jgi:hypothetical protein
MSKKAIMGTLLVASMLTNEYKSSMLNQKQLEGSAIYIPKRHKFKKKNKR